ncbi:MAG TPA: Rieske 2Fe-2S domain-containing protein [Amycolatopsis sp.]|nr:Rieske 2Fe-2S domain-containing protein [Amycolatopsis sp.]
MFVNPDHVAHLEELLLRVDDSRYGAVAVAIVNGKAFAFQDACTHQQCSLSEGFLDEYAVICACHQSVFDVRTGEVLTGPATRPLRTYACDRDGESVTVGPPSDLPA